jgi:hypothetical protein
MNELFSKLTRRDETFWILARLTSWFMRDTRGGNYEILAERRLFCAGGMPSAWRLP